MIPVSDIVAKVGFLLLDSDHIRWTVPELIGWINESAGAIMVRRPAAFARRSVKALAAGTLQSIPEGGAILLDVVRNIGADGTAPGSIVRRTDLQLLDDSDPDWHKTKPKTSVRHYTYDDRAPTQFYVYPPVVAGTKVEVIDAAMPALVDDLTDQYAIAAEYEDAVVSYVAYRCSAKDSEYANPAQAAAFFQAFESSLGGGVQSQAASSPNLPGNSV